MQCSRAPMQLINMIKLINNYIKPLINKIFLKGCDKIFMYHRYEF